MLIKYIGLVWLMKRKIYIFKVLFTKTTCWSLKFEIFMSSKQLFDSTFDCVAFIFQKIAQRIQITTKLLAERVQKHV